MPSDIKEIEVKARVTDKAAVVAKLAALGCTFSDMLRQEDIVFFPKGLQIQDIVPGTNVLRIRKQENKIIFTLKQRSQIELAKIEKEIEVNNAETLEDIIKLLGFEEAVRVTKSRKTGKYKDYTICLDEVEGLGSFIEIEKMTSDDAAWTQEEMFTFLESLGITKKDKETKGYDTLMLQKK